jgi:hypothetical protein
MMHHNSPLQCLPVDVDVDVTVDGPDRIVHGNVPVDVDGKTGGPLTSMARM